MLDLSHHKFWVLVSYYDADISWTQKLNLPYQIYYKNQPDKEPFNAENKAKSESNIMKFIADFYDVLPENTIFVHQYEYKWYHDGSLVDILNDPMLEEKFKKSVTPGYFSLNNCPLGDIYPQIRKMIQSGWWQDTMQPYFGDIRRFHNFTLTKKGAAQFIVNRDRIRSLPRQFYQNMYSWLCQREFGFPGPKNPLTNSRQLSFVDRHVRSSYYLARYLEWTYELMFSIEKPSENNYLNLDGVEIRALYGRDSYYINVTQNLISKFKLDRKIIIKKEIDFNEVFADYLVGTPKILLLHIKNKGSWSLSEKRNEDFILDL